MTKKFSFQDNSDFYHESYEVLFAEFDAWNRLNDQRIQL